MSAESLLGALKSEFELAGLAQEPCAEPHESPSAAAIFGLLLFMVSYLSLKPGSSVQEEFWLPSSWGLLLDIYDAWKNALGFGALALAAFLAWPEGWGRSNWSSRARRIFTGACGVLLIAFFEVVQFFMPGRHCDLADILAGGAGIAGAYGTAALLQSIIRHS
jgi:hypothetical protein